MTENDDSRANPDRATGALEEEEVARLLAEAGGAEPPPAQVQARLDETLAQLVRERGGDVVPLHRRGRSPWGRRLLVAAALLGVVGIGGGLAGSLTGALNGGGSGDATVSSGAEDSGEAAEAPRGASAGDGSARLLTSKDLEDEGALRRAVRALLTPGAAAEGSGAPEADDTDQERARDRRCAAPRVDGAVTADVRYAGRDAVLVARRLGDTLDGRVYDCELGRLLDSVRISAPTGPGE